VAAAGGDPAAATLLRVVDTPGTCDSGALLDDNLQHISEFLRQELTLVHHSAQREPISL
jgi:hypothetical protein